MALDSHPRRFILIVHDVEAMPLDARSREQFAGDFVEIEFEGKLLPSTRKRLISALLDEHFELVERTLA
jgi:hypothetical protein